MKNKLFTIANKLIILTVLAASFLMVANAKTGFSANRQRFIGNLRGQISDETSTGNRIAKTSTVNQNKFDLGRIFAYAIIDAEGLDENEEAYTYLVVDLAELIDKLEGSPEALKLQKVLKSVIRHTADGSQVRKEIESISKTYLAKQKSEQKWYFKSGSTVINLVLASYNGDDAEMKKRLAEIQVLIKIAPKSTSKEILNPMNQLAKYGGQTSFSEDDYVAIFEEVNALNENVAA